MPQHSIGTVTQNHGGIVWRIDNYASSHNCGTKMRSSLFTAANDCECEFFLDLYPHGKSASKNRVIIDLHLTGGKRNENINVKWRVTMCDHSKKAIHEDVMSYREFGKLKVKKTQKTLMEKSDFDRVVTAFRKPDALIINCELEIINEAQPERVTQPKDTSFKSNEQRPIRAVSKPKAPITEHKPLESIAMTNFPFLEAIEYESKLIEHFRTHGERNLRSRKEQKFENISFNYMLLDPGEVGDLFRKGKQLLDKALFTERGNINLSLVHLFDSQLVEQFISSIVYIGMGQGKRPLDHLDDAFKNRQNPSQKPSNMDKIERIQAIWSVNQGPILLQLFTGISKDEAETREALLLNATEHSRNRTNKSPVHYKMPLTQREKNILGHFLLIKAFILFLLNGDGQLKLKFSFN